jgi:hypothetical protein
MVGAKTGRGGDLAAGILIAGVFLTLELVLRHAALVEPDSVRMSYGIAHAIRSGEGLAARDLYGRAVSFGYYALFVRCFPALGAELSALPALMNALNVFCVSAAFIPLVLWMSRLWGRGVAVFSAVLLATAPVIYELGGAGHPSGPAFFLLNTALAIFLVQDRRDGPAFWRIALATAVLFAGATLRATVLLAAPLFPLLGLASRRSAPAAAPAGRPGRVVAAGVAVGVVAALGFLVLQGQVMELAPPRIIAGEGEAAPARIGPVSLLVEHLRTAASGPALAKGFVVSALGVGPLVFVLGWIGIAAAFGRREWALASAAALLLLTNLALWAPHPTPSRHFHQTYLMLVPAAVLWLRSLMRPRHRIRAAAALVALNLLSMAVAYPVIAAKYRFAFVKILPRRTSTRVPMGDPYTNRFWVRRRVAIEVAEARELAAAAEPRLLVFGSPVSLRLLFEITSGSPSYELGYERRYGAVLITAETPQTDYLIHEFAGGKNLPPGELMERIAAAGDLKDFAIAVAPADRLVASEVIVPEGYRRFALQPLPEL